MAYGFNWAFPTTNTDMSAGTSRTSISETGGTAVAVGDRCLFGVAYAGSDKTVSFSSSLGNTYAEVTSAHFYDSGTTFGMRFFTGVVTVAGTETVTATYNTSSLIQSLIGANYTSAAGSIDVVSAPNRQAGVGTGAGALTTAAATVANQPVLFASFIADIVQANGDDMTIVGATSRVLVLKSNGLASAIRMGDKRVTANGSTTQTWTAAQAGSDYYSVAIAIAEGAGGGGGGSSHVGLSLLGVG